MSHYYNLGFNLIMFRYLQEMINPINYFVKFYKSKGFITLQEYEIYKSDEIQKKPWKISQDTFQKLQLDIGPFPIRKYTFGIDEEQGLYAHWSNSVQKRHLIGFRPKILEI